MNLFRWSRGEEEESRRLGRFERAFVTNLITICADEYPGSVWWWVGRGRPVWSDHLEQEQTTLSTARPHYHLKTKI